MRVLITGGAGFIGSHVADVLCGQGHQVRVLDSLDAQVHGEARERPAYLDQGVELVVGDVRDRAAVAQALDGVEAVYHFAARVGVGQSMYQPADYADVNTTGTAILLEELSSRHIGRLIVASSMSIYGEGRVRNVTGREIDPSERPLEQLRRGEWELQDKDGHALEPVRTPEEKTPSLASAYALTKYDQERLCLMFGPVYGIPTVALRLFNVYGPRQALSNPYTGVLAIFACRLLNGNPPLIFEDGRQRRDFVSVHDVARACVQALSAPDAPGRAINIGSGESFTVLEVAHELGQALDRHVPAHVTERYRAGDIRHCFADISLARRVLDYRPQVSLGEGLAELGEWLEGQIAIDEVDRATEELSSRGLTV